MVFSIKHFSFTRTFTFVMLAMMMQGYINNCCAQNDTLQEGFIHMPLAFTSANSGWLASFDLDGDRINDSISFDYTGGVHCCYLINIRLSSDQMLRKFPFEMDGGYIAGVDNSQPEQFDIRDTDGDGLPEVLMKIQTYNLRPYPIPKKWKRKYKISTNHIIIEYDNGKLITRDQNPKSK